MTNVRDWISDFLKQISLRVAVQIMINAVVTSGIIFALFGVISAALGKLGNVIEVSVSLLIILSVFALLGVILVSFLLLEKINIRKTKIFSIQFEDFPRIWKSKVIKRKGEWEILEYPTVYCSRHSLPLALTEESFGYVSYCEMCKEEKIKYQETHANYGFANHNQKNRKDLLGMVKRRMLLELTQSRKR